MKHLLFATILVAVVSDARADNLISKALSVFGSEASKVEFFGINLGMSDADFFSAIPKSECKDLTPKIDKADQFAGITKWECTPKHKVIESIEVAFADKKIYRVDFLFSGKFPDLEESHRAILAKFSGKFEVLSQFGKLSEHHKVLGSCVAWSGGANNCTSRRWMKENAFFVLYSDQGSHSLGLSLGNRDESMTAKIRESYKKFDEQQSKIDRKAASDLGF